MRHNVQRSRQVITQNCHPRSMPLIALKLYYTAQSRYNMTKMIISKNQFLFDTHDRPQRTVNITQMGETDEAVTIPFSWSFSAPTSVNTRIRFAQNLSMDQCRLVLNGGTRTIFQNTCQFYNVYIKSAFI